MPPTVFDTMPDGRPVHAWTLDSGAGLRIRCIEYGAAIVSIEVPDRDGRVADVALGFNSLDAYLAHKSCFGAVVGRVANRIRNGKFVLDGTSYVLPLTPNGLHLHGGPRGFDKQVWTGTTIAGGLGVRFDLTSPDGDQGYPGTCSASVSYVLSGANEIVIDFHATADAPTPLNLSQHTYFNLAGEGSGDVLGHMVTLHASRFTVVDDVVTPTGEIRSVDGTPLDFRSPETIGARIDADDEQMRLGTGYDHNYVIDRHAAGLAHAAHVVDPVSGRTLDVHTTEPGVQFYAGNWLDGTLVGKSGATYGRRHGFCLETQHFPNSVNIDAFPSTILRPGQTFRSRTVFQFGVATPITKQDR